MLLSLRETKTKKSFGIDHVIISKWEHTYKSSLLVWSIQICVCVCARARSASNLGIIQTIWHPLIFSEKNLQVENIQQSHQSS